MRARNLALKELYRMLKASGDGGRGGCPLTGVRKQFPEEVTFKGAKE